MTTPLGAILTLSLAIIVFYSRRQIAVVAIIATVCYLTEGQPLVLAGFHFTAVRFVLMAGLARVVLRGELSQLRLNTIDRFLVIYASALLIIGMLRVGTSGEFVYQLGCLYNVFASYFVFRSLLREKRDLVEVLAGVAPVLVPLSLLIFFEASTGRNLFSVFGGVPDVSWIRDGHVRCQGPFRNPITAGAFGATFCLLFASLLFARVRGRFALVGIVASTLIVVCAHSSGPLLGFALGLLTLACWPLRLQTRKIMWGIVAVLLGLQVVMTAPVWFLLARVSHLTGGGGYHRAELIDQFVHRFSSWWLMGTSDTSDWFPYQLANGQSDMANKFVLDGVSGGLVGLILSIGLVACCFQRLGLAMRAIQGDEPTTERLLWGIGSTLVGSVGILFSVPYFDQMWVIWYFLLACIVSLDVRRRRAWQAALPRSDQRTHGARFSERPSKDRGLKSFEQIARVSG